MTEPPAPESPKVEEPAGSPAIEAAAPAPEAQAPKPPEPEPEPQIQKLQLQIIQKTQNPRGSFWRGVVDFLRAAMFGASFVTTLLGVFILLDKERIFDFDKNPVIGVGVMAIAPLALAVLRGFPAPARGLKRIAGRTLGTALLGGLLFGAQLLGLILLDDAMRMNDRETAMAALFGGLALFAVSWLRVRSARKRLLLPEPAPLVVERRPGPYFWAGGLAAGMLGWLLATALAFDASDLLGFSLDDAGPLFFILGVASVIFGASRGFSIELRRGLPFGSRFFLTLICSLLAGLGLFVLIMPVGMLTEPSKLGTAVLITLPSMALMGAALWRGRRIAGEGRRGRLEAGALAAAVVLLTLWPQSAWMRYALGSAGGAKALSMEHFEREDYTRAATFAAVACERGDTESCVMAAHIHRTGLGVPSSLKQAARLVGRACRSPERCAELAEDTSLQGSRDLLFARACELGDRKACLRGRREALSRRCKAGDAFGCRALAETFDDNPSQKSVLYGIACELGDTSACPPKPAR
ncbi:MAG: sel1 repeat family protein [Polyangiaceae bacterium]|nr:sel1 repeat family protein [Polyangiaceae bacterium]